MNNELKKCPYCGEEIKKQAIKCKHCGEYLEASEEDSDNVDSTTKPKGCLIGCISIFVIMVIIGMLVPDTTSTSTSDNNSTEKVQEDYYEEPQKVTGDYSGFGSWAVMTANYGGQDANCLERGVGESLVELIENEFEQSSPNRSPLLYNLAQASPRLKFEVTNPRWAENVDDWNRCIADINFTDYNPDVIAGYTGYGNNKRPFYVNEAQYGVTYYVSKRGDKYKAIIRAIGSDPIRGYHN